MNNRKYISILLSAAIILLLTPESSYCRGTNGKIKVVGVNFKLVSEKPVPGCVKMVAKDSGKKLYVEKTSRLSTEDLDSVTVGVRKINKSNKKQASIRFNFNERGKKKLARLTSKNIHKRLGIIVSGELTAAPLISEPINGGAVEISGAGISRRYAQDAARSINMVINLRKAIERDGKGAKKEAEDRA